MELKLGVGQRTLADRVFVAMHDAITRGDIAPGERLPIEDVAALLDVSPMPVREALRRLDAVGLVEHVPHRGARVAELSIRDLQELYEARLALEPLAVRRGAERLTQSAAEAATVALQALGKLARRSDSVAWEAHTEFHFSLYRAAESRWLIRLITPLWESSGRYRLSTPSRSQLGVRHEEHEQILDAVLRRRPAQAAALMHNHLATTANELAAGMGAEELFPPVRVGRGTDPQTAAYA